MNFLVIPALDLKDGKCVRLVQGDPKRKSIEIDNPLEIAKHFEALGAPRLHLVDLDGAIQGVRKNEALVKKIIQELSIPVQLGGGMRSVEDARYFLDFGAERIILGTLAIENTNAVASLSEKYGKERVTIALDCRGGYVAIKGWQERTKIKATEIVKKFEAHASEVLFTSVDVEGMLRGIDENGIREMVKATSLGVIVSGGISSLSDVETVKKLGARGAVIGSAIYKGKIDLSAALALAVRD